MASNLDEHEHGHGHHENDYDCDDDDDFEEEDFTAIQSFNEDVVDVLHPNLNISYEFPLLSSDNGVVQEPKLMTTVDDCRGPFQRIWTEEDEIVILEGFRDFVTRRGTTHNNYQHDTGPFYEEIKTKIHLAFSKNQLIEKIRRLKKKYRTVDGKMKAMGEAFAFKSAHEKATFDISKQIWCTTSKRTKNRRCNSTEKRNLDGTCNNGASAQPMLIAEDMAREQQQTCPASVSSVVEDTVKSCLSPLLKELLQHQHQHGPTQRFLPNYSFPPLCLPINGLGHLGKGLDGERWKEQQIMELEVYLKRVEMLQEHIKVTLEELRSSLSWTSSSMNVDG